MATSAFKSTTRRAPIGTSSPSTDESASSASSKAHRRSRSLSRFSRPTPAEVLPDVVPTPRRKFVNTVRGSDFPEISLDDLAIEFFSANDNSSGVDDERGRNRSSRPTRPSSEIGRATASSQRRSRSVSRHGNDGTAASAGGSASVTASSQRRGRSVSRRNDGGAVASNNAAPDVNTRRRRSVSVARYQISDSESDIDRSLSSASQTKIRSINNGNSQIASFQKLNASSHRRLGRSMSQKPGPRSHDGYSSHSSALTDDESRDAHYGRNGIEKTIRAVYAQKKMDHPTGDDVNHELYEVMRKELRSAVNEIRIELEEARERKPSALAVHDRLHLSKSDVFQTVSDVGKNYPTKSRQRTAEMDLEEQRLKDGTRIVREVLPDSKSNVIAQRVSHSRRRSNDRSRVSKRLNEEAEKYLEDFISNVEDTDFSSFDGERSDTSSSLGGITKRREGSSPNQIASPAACNSLPVEMEGINLPWLKWDSNDGSPLTSQNTMQPPATPKNLLWDPSQDLKLIQEPSSQSTSSHGSWNPEPADAHSANTRERGSKPRQAESGSRSHFDMEKYLDIQRSEELLFESWRERNMISSGGLMLCGNVL